MLDRRDIVRLALIVAFLSALVGAALIPHPTNRPATSPPTVTITTTTTPSGVGGTGDALGRRGSTGGTP